MPWKHELPQEVVPPSLSGAFIKPLVTGAQQKKLTSFYSPGTENISGLIVEHKPAAQTGKTSKRKQKAGTGEEEQKDPVAEYCALSRVEIHPNLEEFDFSTCAQDVQGILINPDWNLDKVDGSNDEGHSIYQFKKLKFSATLAKETIAFVWVEKEVMGEVISHMEKERFNYVENVCWIHLDIRQKASKTFRILIFSD